MRDELREGFKTQMKKKVHWFELTENYTQQFSSTKTYEQQQLSERSEKLQDGSGRSWILTRSEYITLAAQPGHKVTFPKLNDTPQRVSATVRPEAALPKNRR